MEKRAILFGMFHYTNNRSISADELPSTAFDVMILEKKLKQLQFKTSSYIDLGLKDVELSIILSEPTGQDSLIFRNIYVPG